MRTRNPTIQVLLPSGQATDERARLFAGLEKFVNLGDSAADFERFAQLWPTFYPVEIRKGKPPMKPLGFIPELHLVVLGYRDYLRRVWISDPDVDALGLADILLGLQIQVAAHGSEPARRMRLRDLISPKFVIDSLVPQGGDQSLSSATVVASWRTGDFNYFPLTDFQRAFYQLFREKWRARTCAQCARYFIADKPPQHYCSTACYGKAKRSRSLSWWRTKGDARRRERVLRTRGRRPLKRRK